MWFGVQQVLGGELSAALSSERATRLLFFVTDSARYTLEAVYRL